MGNDINVIKIFDAVTIAASGTSESRKLDLTAYLPANAFSIQVELTGDGTCKAEALMSNNGDDFLVPEGASEIFTGKTVASGPGADGKFIDEFVPEAARHMQIKLTETGTTDGIVVSAWLMIQ